MNYRHAYHAGNFADVFKHVLLITLIQALHRKEKPFCYLETHAGIGHYDLMNLAAQKTREFENGILKLWQLSASSLPEPLSHYLQLVQRWNQDRGCAELRYYPGSPCLVRKCLRSQDQMILNELHPQDFFLLKHEFFNDRQVAVHRLDGYQALKAFLPPKESRGLIFIDPPFEKKDDFKLINDYLHFAIKRFGAGTYVVWYPIKELVKIDNFYQQLKISGMREILYCEFKIPAFSLPTQLNACGMVVIHPPWQWKEQVTEILPELAKILGSPAADFYQVGWLVGE